MFIPPEHPAFFRGIGERLKDCVSAAQYFPLWRDNLDSPFKALSWNLRKIFRNFLKRRDGEAVSGDGLPVFNPEPAEMAVPIINEQRSMLDMVHTMLFR